MGLLLSLQQQQQQQRRTVCGGSFLLGFQVGVEITMPIAFAAEAWPVMTWKIVFTSCKEESFLKGFFF